MNYYFDAEHGKNIENYLLLAASIIEQAVRDIGEGFKVQKKLKFKDATSRKDVEAMNDAYDAEIFLRSQWFTGLSSGKIDGKTVIRKAKENFNKYGKTLLTDEDIDNIRRGVPVDAKTRSTIRRGLENSKGDSE